MSDIESDKEPGDSSEVAVHQRIVRITADVLQAAAEVLRELDRRDGLEFVVDDPSLMEMIGVANLIVTGTVSGFYEIQKEPKPVIDPLTLSKMIEGVVRLELAKQQNRPPFMVPPVPPTSRAKARPTMVVCPKCQGSATYVATSEGGIISCRNCNT